MTSKKRQRSSLADSGYDSAHSAKRIRVSDNIIDLTADDSSFETFSDDCEITFVSSMSKSKKKASEPVGDEEDEEMRDILAQIAAQEEDERLARQLQAQEAGSSHSGRSKGKAGDEEMSELFDAVWESTGEKPASSSKVEALGPEATPSIPPSGVKPPDIQLEEFRALFTAERPCTKCGKMVPSPTGYVMFKGNGIPPSIGVLLHARCSSCRQNHCRGCFKATSCTSGCKGTPKKGDCPVLSCCAEGRAIAICELLGGFDWHLLGEQETSATRAQAAVDRRAQASSHRSVGPGGTGYSIGYTGRGDHSNSKPKNSRAEALSKHWDELVTRAFKLLNDLLPRQYEEGAKLFDILPHSSLGSIMALSTLPDYIASLLRNDSVSDWINRSEVYYALLALLRRLVDCELTIGLLIEPRFERRGWSGITKWMWREADVEWCQDKSGAIETSPPLVDYFRKLTRQCESLLAGASNSELLEAGDGSDEDAVKAASLCGDIIAAKDEVERAMAAMGIVVDLNKKGKGKHTSGQSEVAIEQEYSRACEKLAFNHIEFLAYTTVRDPKDRFQVIKELAVMATSLPEGIFVRVDESRNDTLKAIIAGPQSTPYAGGLFEFDIHLPSTYPNTAPLFNLRTTGKGTVRFNPNLYNCGKVCLSLLGTWSGSADEQWKPGKSTIFQVLISIQSMILVECPYFNEPGFGQVDPNNQGSIAYNKNIRVQTARWAIVDWLKDEHRNGMWADVISAHFLIRKDIIRKQLRTWASESPSMNYLLDEFEQGLRTVERWKLNACY
ncbi:ubiquitinating enzyme [Moniliophthora roreri MCA 2997]|uniref:Ubiquitinating enzyme n=1 Tax=Moniliophthora roreri (strain MCA 2997) TaxID=1381753 RepID=V2X3T8_MONRO|nr:ubiquitinating enzyme [Moniliophthora roreri MCA 2997]